MEKIFCLIISVFLLTSCAVQPEQPTAQQVDKQANPQPEIVLQDELLNEPPEHPRFIIARYLAADAVEQTIVDSIKQQLLRLGYVEAESRDDANVVIWYNFDSAQTGMRQVGRATDAWGDQAVSAGVSDAATINAVAVDPRTVDAIDVTTVMPVSFKVQIISLQESRLPEQVIPIWQGEWSSSVPGLNLTEFSRETLAQVFELYQSEQTQLQIAAFAKARERRVKAAVNTYMKMVMYRIQKNWQKPRYNVKGKKCEVKIVQSAVGEIRSHQLLACDKDRRFRKSIEKAIKASSPLPLPKEHLFDRSELILIFQG